MHMSESGTELCIVLFSTDGSRFIIIVVLLVSLQSHRFVYFLSEHSTHNNANFQFLFFFL